MRPALIASLASAALAGACGHVPLTSLPKLAKIDFKTTRLADLRAGISLPSDIQPAPGGVTMTVTVEPKEGGRHERTYVLEEVKNATELASLPVIVTPGRRFTLFRLNAADAARLGAFRQEWILTPDGKGNRGSLALNAHKACRTADLTGRPIPMTSYIKTSETQDFVMLTRDLDLRDAVREADKSIDIASAIPPCEIQGPRSVSGSPAAP